MNNSTPTATAVSALGPHGRSKASRGALRQRRSVVAAAVVLALAVPTSLGAATANAAPNSTRASAPGGWAAGTASARIQSLIAQMTLDEKLSFVERTTDPSDLGEAAYIPGVPRLGIPPLRLTDSPAGIRINQPATAMPAPVMLASSFDDQLARQYGQTMGTEGRALKQDVLLGPMVNTIRVPQGGRNFESLSEDPLLNSNIGASEIKGIQSAGLIATVKHLAENNQETNRMTVNVNVDEQTLREVELPAYQAAVDAGVGAVMCSYNSVNGVHSCSDDDLLNGILKAQWGFAGWVMSDWGATHATTDITAGLDQDNYNLGSQDNTYFSDQLKAAIAANTVRMSVLNASVARILGQMERFGLLDGAATHRPALNLKAGAKVAQVVAESGAVLLKNTAQALPLSSKDKAIALIGPTAKDPKIGGGGSAMVVPPSAASPLSTITQRAGKKTSVTYAAGLDTTGVGVPATNLVPALAAAGAGTTTSSTIFYNGTLTVPTAGTYTFNVNTPAGYGSLAVDGVAIATAINTSQTGSITLTAGAHPITFFATPLSAAPTVAHLSWITPQASAVARAAAVAVAKKVTTPIVFAYDDGTEGADRAGLSLPADQDQLIADVAAANPNTIVVLNTGSSVTMPWLPKVKSVLDMYYPGESGAEATAALLFGDVNPSGKLSQTFPASDTVTPVSGDPLTYPGVNNQENYTEGIYVGYKWYDKTNNKPLFPFGYGLSYTTFKYSNFSVQPKGRGNVTVSFTLTNTGRKAGQEVAQAYVGPSANVTEPQAVRKLVGYQKVALAAGQSRHVAITIPAQQFKYWNVATHTWEIGTGTRALWVGGSSAALPLHGSTNIRK